MLTIIVYIAVARQQSILNRIKILILKLTFYCVCILVKKISFKAIKIFLLLHNVINKEEKKINII